MFLLLSKCEIKTMSIKRRIMISYYIFMDKKNVILIIIITINVNLFTVPAAVEDTSTS